MKNDTKEPTEYVLKNRKKVQKISELLLELYKKEDKIFTKISSSGKQ